MQFLKFCLCIAHRIWNRNNCAAGWYHSLGAGQGMSPSCRAARSARVWFRPRALWLCVKFPLFPTFTTFVISLIKGKKDPKQLKKRNGNILDAIVLLNQLFSWGGLAMWYVANGNAAWILTATDRELLASEHGFGHPCCSNHSASATSQTSCFQGLAIIRTLHCRIKGWLGY